MNLKHGIHNIYKPAGPTSHDIIDQVRKLSGEKRVGHAGTLDPFAEGVLIVGIGREYTKQLGKFLKQDKTYRAMIKLGAISDTGDLTGKIIGVNHQLRPAEKEVKKILKNFVGKIEQMPPAFSAIKIKGQKAYELARRGVVPDLKPRQIKIYHIKVLKYRWPRLEIEAKVSSGTYIRSLAHDIGQALKTGGYLERLTRIKVGRLNYKKSWKLLLSAKIA